MEIMKSLYGEKDASLAFCLQRLGGIYYGSGNMERALEIFLHAKSILRAVPIQKKTT
jgi:hypothetical protein